MSVPSNLIPTRIPQLPIDPDPSVDGWLIYTHNGVTYRVQVSQVVQVSGVPLDRQVIAGTGLSGGGALSSNVTLGISPGGVGTTELEDSGVAAGTYGSGVQVPVLDVDAKGRITSISIEAVEIVGYVPVARQVVAGDGLTGGGALNADRTFAVDYGVDPPVSGSELPSAGAATTVSRSDHSHPAVNLGVDDEVDGILGLDNGGTARSLVPEAGGIVWSGADGLYIGPQGLAGQVVVSGGAGEPTWGSALIISDQAANLVYAGPASGAAAPTGFRLLVNADLPDSGVVAGTYGSAAQVPVLTVDEKGIITGVSEETITIATVEWADVQNTPTTLAGYGITDAAANGANADITSLTGITGEIATPTVVSFDTTSSLTALAGQLTWNQDDGTLDLGMNGGSVIQQIGLETYTHIRADSNISNGQVVMVTGAVGASGRLTGAPATGITIETSKDILGIATEDIAAGEWGFITNFGQVRGFDTSAWAEGDALFLDPTVAGGLTNVMPVSPNPKVCLGYVINSHATVGSVQVKIRFSQGLGTLADVELTDIAEDDSIIWNATTQRWENALAELETGFSTNDTIVTVYDPIARTVTLSGVGTLYYRGAKILDVADGHVSDPHPDTNGPWFYYYDGSAFVWSSSPWVFGEDAMIAYVNYGAVDKFAIRECHGLMGWESHKEFHEQVGTYRRSGGDVVVVTGSAVTADKQPTVAQTIIADEDLPSTLPALGKGSYTHFYLTGSGDVTFSLGNTHIASVDGGTGRLQYNQNNGGTWQFTTINVNNNFHVVYLVGLPVTSDAGSQAYRYAFFQGQTLYTSLATAQDATFSDLNTSTFASLAPEWVVLEKFILRSSNVSDGWTVEQNDRIVTNRTQVLIGGAGITSHTLLEDRDALDQHPVTSITGITGDGLTLVVDELTLGTPSSITSSSTNSVTATSHTHELTGIAGGTF